MDVIDIRDDCKNLGAKNGLAVIECGCKSVEGGIHPAEDPIRLMMVMT